MTSKKVFTLVITFTAILNLVFSSTSTSFRPLYIGCQSNEECEPGFCCSMLPDKYSSPRCKPMRQEGEVCRPTPSTLNTTLGYPDGSQVELKDVYYIMCPCSTDLTCDTSDGKCRDLSEKTSSNKILSDPID